MTLGRRVHCAHQYDKLQNALRVGTYSMRGGLSRSWHSQFPAQSYPAQAYPAQAYPAQAYPQPQQAPNPGVGHVHSQPQPFPGYASGQALGQSSGQPSFSALPQTAGLGGAPLAPAGLQSFRGGRGRPATKGRGGASHQ